MKILPPWLIDVRVKEPGKKGFRIWVPFVIFWPLMLVLGLVALVVTLVVDVVLFIVGARYHHFTKLLLTAFQTFNECRGLKVDVQEESGEIVHVAIS
jgi:hypothetical protein